MLDIVTCMLSCPSCGVEKLTFAVEARGDAEDVIDWIDGKVRPAMTRVHQIASPLCHGATCSLYLPVAPGDNRVGRVTRQ